MNRLKDLRAVVTGGADGLGAAIARTFIAEGAKVVVTDVNGTLLHEVQGANPAAHALAADLRDSESAQAITDFALARLGGVDILVNNAGVRGPRQLLEDMQRDEWRDVMSINLDAVFNLSSAMTPIIVKSANGRIINMASLSSVRAVANVGAYTASKHALLGLTRALASDLASRGVTVNAIMPGLIGATGLTRDIPPDREAYITRNVPLGRLGTPQDVAAAALFLASPEAAFITGIGLPVDGGAGAVH